MKTVSLDGFLKFLLEAVGDPQLAFASYTDAAHDVSVRNLRDDLRARGIDIQSIPTAQEVKHLQFLDEQKAKQAPAAAAAEEPAEPPTPPASELGK